MPYYYVTIRYVSKITGLLLSLGGYNMSEKGVRRHIVEPFLSGISFVFLGKVIDPKLVEEIHIYELNKKVEDILTEKKRERFTGPGVLIYEDVYRSIDDVLEKIRDGEIGKEVTNQYITSLAKVSKERIPKKTSRNIFIVHGRDTKPVEELKAMLKEFSLNPIVLHEQPSGCRTIVEKLEKYSDVGYVFIILTPDDVGALSIGMNKTLKSVLETLRNLIEAYTVIKKKGGLKKAYNELYSVVGSLKARARQNVVLEFGYFMGLLGRDRVCCLYKGNVELPSDMHGIVYIPFKESVKECHDKIIKELKAAGYEIR